MEILPCGRCYCCGRPCEESFLLLRRERGPSPPPEVGCCCCLCLTLCLCSSGHGVAVMGAALFLWGLLRAALVAQDLARWRGQEEEEEDPFLLLSACAVSAYLLLSLSGASALLSACFSDSLPAHSVLIPVVALPSFALADAAVVVASSVLSVGDFASFFYVAAACAEICLSAMLAYACWAHWRFRTTKRTEKAFTFISFSYV